MITGYISSKVIINKLYRDLQLNSQLDEVDIQEWVAEALKLIGAYGQFREVSDCIELNKGKAKLPCDFYKLVDIHYDGIPMYWSSNVNASNYQCPGCDIPVCDNCDLTFYINSSHLITNINVEHTAKVCLIYLALPVDEENYPLIPEDVYYEKAVTSYVIHMRDYADWRKGKITDKVFKKSEQDWLFYVNSAKGSANMPNTAQLDNIHSIWNRLIPNPNAYRRFFDGFNRRERRRLK